MTAAEPATKLLALGVLSRANAAGAFRRSLIRATYGSSLDQTAVLLRFVLSATRRNQTRQLVDAEQARHGDFFVAAGTIDGLY